MTHALPKRWWSTSRRLLRRDEWYSLYIDKLELIATAVTGPISMLGAIPSEVDAEYLDRLGACPVCERIDSREIRVPERVEIRHATRSDRSVDKRMIRNLWITRAIGTRVTIVHAKLLDALSPWLDGTWILGEVRLELGERIPDLISVVDPVRVDTRAKYSPNWFKRHGSSRLTPCHGCGRINDAIPGGEYVLDAEISGPYARADRGGLLVPAEAVERLDLLDRQKWPLMRGSLIDASPEPLDPMPSPLPVWWEEFEMFHQEKGLAVPFPPHDFRISDRPGPWLARQIKDRGPEVCLGQRHMDRPGLRDASRLIYLARIRAMWEPRMHAFVIDKADEEIAAALAEHFNSGKDFDASFPLRG